MKFAGWLAIGLFLALALAPRAGTAASVSSGHVLFDNYCRACHGFPPSGGAQFGAGNPARITAAIGGVVPAMAFLRTFVSTADVADLAAYLATVAAPTGPVIPAFDFSDLWWNAAEPGWGLNLVQHASSNIFGVMYTYETPNRPLWLVIPGGAWATPMQFSGPIYRVTGPVAVPFDSTKVNVRQVGVATLVFNDRNNGLFTFSVDGTQVTKAITRQPF